jgi:diketogulonate reductase-like aldo/keto reductase
MTTQSHDTPVITLNNGLGLPVLGIGVFQSPPAETFGAVEAALDIGYRLIDTAASYMNEREVGEAIRKSAVNRSELFIQTKLWISDYGYDSALRAYDASLRKLGLDYVDLYLLHQPMPNEWERTVAAYTAAERLLADGRVRAVGVCNFSPNQLEDLIARTDVVPAINQVEVHPFFVQRALRDVHQRLGIATQAWSPLGGVNVYMPKRPNAPESAKALKSPLGDPVITRLADTHGKTPAQIILRWHVEHGVSAIPKSVRPSRIAENFDVFDFELTADEIASIDAMDTNVRGGPDPDRIDTKVFTLKIPD